MRRLSLLSLMLIVIACGSSAGQKKASGRSLGPIEAALQKASSEQRVPMRLLLAIGLQESGLNPLQQSAKYPGMALGSALTDSAFGITRRQLELPDGPDGDSLPLQIHAYARWLRRNLEQKKLTLKDSPTSAQDTYDWVWQTALLHRDSQNERRNIRVIFAIELLEKLNRGGLWQDPESGELIELTKEREAMRPERLAPEVQQTMTLSTDEGPFPAARFLEMTYVQVSERRNKPTYIRVIHCPLTLSACLELQNPNNSEDQIRLGAHYVIPSERHEFNGFNKILQIAQHRDVVTLTNRQGLNLPVEDSIVVMLTGNSGHYVQGQRLITNPKWYSEEQLMKLGNLVKNVCPLLKAQNPEIDLGRCVTANIPGGVHFSHQDRQASFQWGDIPDYSESVFNAYIKNPQGLPGNALFEFPQPQKLYNAGQPIDFKVRFLAGAARVIVERADRCPDGKIVWSGLQALQVRGTNSQAFRTTLFYRGPNGNGEHFLRTLVYNSDNNLAGWAIDSLFLKGYDKEAGPGPAPDDCAKGGN